MPRNNTQRMVFALLTVLVTVHAYVFYSIFVINGDTLMEVTGQAGVLEALHYQGGVYMFGNFMPIWSIVLVEFAFAFTLEMIMGSPCSFKLACKIFDPKTTHPVLFETSIICATAALMCPAMSLVAAFLYYPYYAGFDILTAMAIWGKLVCYNFPFAILSQLFFIQPLIRLLFRNIYKKDIAARKEEY